MTLLAEKPKPLAVATHGETILAEPWSSLDDAQLLAYYRGPRTVQYFPVADAIETQPAKIDAILRGSFEFNGEIHLLPDPVDWLTNPSNDLEWHILLHKFYYAVGLGLAFARTGDSRYARRWNTLIDGWIHTTQPGFIAADVTGRRVQNWIYSYHLFITHPAHVENGAITAAFHRRLLNSIHQQVEFLCENLTPKRNHRTLELYAIFLAGVVFPEMRRAAHWRTFALEQTVANIQSDLLADGVHCELSTDYHHLVLKNYLNLRRLATTNGIAIPSAMDRSLQRGLEFSMHVHRPDGIVPSLSDGDARSFLDLLQDGAGIFDRDDMLYVATRGVQGTPPMQRVAHFEQSGYAVVRSTWGTGPDDFDQAQFLVFDCGPLGEGNHGHFDALSFELAAHGRPLIVDPGRYTYSEAVNPADDTNWRVHFRGTAAHNTVCVDGKQQTRYVPKRMGPQAMQAGTTPRHKISGPAAESQFVERFHTACFDLLHGQVQSHEYDVVHNRCIVFVDQTYWIVSDWLRAHDEQPHQYTLNFQLAAHAQGRAALTIADGAQLLSPGLLIAQPAQSGIEYQVKPSWVSQRYGDKQPAPALQATQHAREADFDSLLLPWRHQKPKLKTSLIQVKSDSYNTSARVLRVDLVDHGERVSDYWYHVRGASETCGRLGRFDFQGRWLYWREAADGRVLHTETHADAILQGATGAIELTEVRAS